MLTFSWGWTDRAQADGEVDAGFVLTAREPGPGPGEPNKLDRARRAVRHPDEAIAGRATPLPSRTLDHPAGAISDARVLDTDIAM